MILSVAKKFLRSRKSATAVAMAIMTVPLIIAASAAVDFSRVASARTLLQASVDSAAVAGAGAYQTSELYTSAENVASDTYTGTGRQLPSFITAVSTTFGAYCSPLGSSTQCGTGSTSTGGLSANCPSGWNTGDEYCVVVSAHVTLANSLFAWLIPSEALSAQAVATTSFPPDTINQGSFSDTSVGKAYDLGGIYAYVVPKDSSGNPEYNNVPTPNSSCNSTANGPIYYEPNKVAVASSVPCNYLLIGQSIGGSGVGSLTFSDTSPIAFSYVLDSGKTTNYGASSQNYTSELYVNNVYYPIGDSLSNSYDPPGSEVCSGPSHNQTCTYPGGTAGTVYSTPETLSAQCPNWNLYGSIGVYSDSNTNGYGTTTTGGNIVPVQDSINTYSSAYEILGYPPTHATNHWLTPFLGPLNSVKETVYQETPNNSTGKATITSQTTQTYYVQAICPQWPLANTTISALAPANSFTLSPTGYAAATSTNSPAINVYSTFYPDTTNSPSSPGNSIYTSGTNSFGNNIYPPEISGCTPATSASDGGVTTGSSWWGWTSNGTNLGNCTLKNVNSNNTTTTTPNNQQSSGYTNCALLIQPLGNQVPTSGGNPKLPDYYSYIVDPGAFTAKTTGNDNNIIGGPFPLGAPANIQNVPVAGMNPYYSGSTYPAPLASTIPVSNKITVTNGTGQEQVVNSESSGYFPTSTTTSTTNVPSGEYNVTEEPAANTATPPTNDTDPPPEVSNQCYDPQYNGISSSQLPATDTPNNDPATALPADPVANPGLGAVECNQNTPQSYALYWNDMGGVEGDDLGYQNAITVFTCPKPSQTNAGGGPATLSG